MIMTNLKPRPVLYRRKREGKTNYNKRLKLLTSPKPRLAVRFTNTKIIGQIIKFDPKGDLVLASAVSTSLKKEGWNSSVKNLPAAYLTGFILGKKAVKEGVKQAVLDAGFKRPEIHGKIYAFLKGALDAGLEIPYGDESIFPDSKIIEGQHLKKDIHDSLVKIKQNWSKSGAGSHGN